MTAQKIYVLNTDVLLEDPYSIFSFDEHHVVVADSTIDELIRTQEKGSGEQSRNALAALRIVEDLRAKGDVITGVPLPNGGVFSIWFALGMVKNPESWSKYDSQMQMLDVCKAYEHQHPQDDAILVTNNLATKLRADMLGLLTEPYRTDLVPDIKDQYTGRGELFVSEQDLSQLYSTGSLPLSPSIELDDIQHNKYYLLKNSCNPKHTGLARFILQRVRTVNGKPQIDGYFKLVHTLNPWGIQPKNVGQVFALDALMAPPSEIPCVILKGGAGTGKTILSLAAALQGVLDDHTYDRCLITRPNTSMDRDIGFLPGDTRSKLAWVQAPITDNLEELLKNSAMREKDGIVLPTHNIEELFDSQKFVIEALGFMRGRSISHKMIIVDESQNMSRLQAFSIISRVGVDTKIVLCGDVEQIDPQPHPLDGRNNGLSFASERMKGSPLVAQVAFTHDECVRSPLAMEALKHMAPKGYGF